MKSNVCATRVLSLRGLVFHRRAHGQKGAVRGYPLAPLAMQAHLFVQVAVKLPPPYQHHQPSPELA